MRRQVLLLSVPLLIVSLAGCLGGDSDGDGGDGSQGDPVPRLAGDDFAFMTALVDDTYGTGEPSILAAPDGTLWIVGPTGFAKGIVERSPEPYTHDSGVFWSKDGGVTWNWHEQIPGYGRDACVGGGDSDIAASSDGSLFLIDLNLENVPIDVSYDGGETWLFNCNTAIEAGVDRQWVAATDEHVWISVNHLALGPIVYRSDRLGLPAGDGLVFGPAQETEVGGMIVVDQAHDGTLYLAGSGARVGVSHDDGDTWEYKETGLQGTNHSHSFISLALDGQGNVFVIGSGNDGIVVSGSSDKGETWTPAAHFKPYDGDYGFTWIAAGGDGVVYFAWYGRPAENDTTEFRQDLHGFYLYAAQSTDILSAGAEATATYALVDPRPLTTKNLCTGINLVGFVQCDQADPSATRALGDFFEVGMDLEGNLLITYVSEYEHDPPVTYFAKQVSGLRAPPNMY